MKTLLFSLLCLLALCSAFGSRGAFAQTVVTGRVLDERGRALPGANVSLRGTYDGANADSTGAFRFRTRRDTATLVVSYIGYVTDYKLLTISPAMPALTIRLAEEANELNTVVITAGTFEASDKKRMAVLKPLDIVTTAGGRYDVTSVVNLLPGAQRVGEQEGLFVRGGSALESKVVIDGMIVQDPFFSATPNLSARGRFQPFMFSGTAFSTGGYSAQYGQALSGVLLLTTTDKGNNNGLGLSLNLASAGLSYDHATDRASVSATAYYGNLKPLFALVPQNIDWLRVPTFAGSSLTWRLRVGKMGLLKAYGMYSDSRSGLNFVDPARESGKTSLNLHNQNTFLTGTYTDDWDEGRWQFTAGLSYSRNRDDLTYDQFRMDRGSERTQARLVLTRFLNGNSSVLFGAEAYRLTLSNAVYGKQFGLGDTYLATFAESETYLTRKLALRLGGRLEYNSRQNRLNAAPRLSLAYKTGAHSQVSLAAGQFYQTPDYQYLYRTPGLNYEQANHLILNYQHIHNNRTFRVETFYKQYSQLVREFDQTGGQARYDADPYRFPSGPTTNGGSGYARGLDVFWRDQTTVKGLDYWVSYSYVDTKRLVQQYPTAATPTFVSDHNLSLITKRFFTGISTSVGLTYAFTSGRPYYNPNRPEGEFLTDRTPAVHTVSLTASHVRIMNKTLLILYASVDNLLDSKLIYTYRYTPDGATRHVIGPQTYRSFFVGAQVMLNRKAKASLNNL
jgi:hypothetical protein